MIPVLFATKTYYTVKENNYKKTFAELSSHFADVNYQLAGENLESLFCTNKIAAANYHFLEAN